MVAMTLTLTGYRSHFLLKLWLYIFWNISDLRTLTDQLGIEYAHNGTVFRNRRIMLTHIFPDQLK